MRDECVDGYVLLCVCVLDGSCGGDGDGGADHAIVLRVRSIYGGISLPSLLFPLI